MKLILLITFICLIALSSITGCKKPYQKTSDMNLPAVNTQAANATSQISALSGGSITSDGGSTITSRGVCWNIKHNPTTDNYNTIDGMGNGDFISNISGLLPDTKYYVRAYAVNFLGIAYGNEVSFKTP